jgi:hypothetical protein
MKIRLKRAYEPPGKDELRNSALLLKEFLEGKA